MTEKRYLLTETELLELLEDRYRLAALEAMGVDNWDGYETDHLIKTDTYDGFTFNSYVKAKELLRKQLSL